MPASLKNLTAHPHLFLMAGNYFKTTWRSLVRDRQFAILNLVGLSVALSCVLLIYLWVSDEMSVDKFHADNDRLYEVMSHIKLPDGIHTQEATPYMLSRALAKEMPEVDDAVCLMKGFIKGTLSVGDRHTKTTKYFADYDFFKLFSFPLIEGNKNHVLDDKYSVVLSDRLAKKLFNTTKNILGKTVQWENDPQLFTVTGIFEEPSTNSSLQFDALFSYELYFQNDPDTKDWSNGNPYTFLLLKKGADAKKLESRLTGFLHAKYDKSPLTLSLRKFSDRYLYDRYENGIQAGGRIRYVKLFSIIAVFILVIACINFMNLSTAKAARRLKEAGIKKILGAERSSLIFQYISESMLMAFLALAVALLLAFILMPEFNSITGKQLSLHFTKTFVSALASIGFLTGLLAGSYPAFYLSGFKPVIALKGKLSTAWGELWLRKGLVVFQYTLSVLFIVAVMVIYKQIKLIQTIDLGYSKSNIISFKIEKRIGENFNAFMTDVQNTPGVLAASSINGDMYGNSSGSTEHANWEGNTTGTKIMMTDLDIDYGLIELLGMKMAAGRSFSKDFGSDSLEIILNESAVNAMGIKDPVGKSFDVWGGKFHIIGVAKDFHFESLYEKVKPCFMRWNRAGENILVKITGGKERETIAKLNDVYKKYNPGMSFDYGFMDKDYKTMYINEERESILFRWFAALAIIISCLGLFGLAAFSAQKRQKEMSIRKVVGASLTDIATLLSKDFFKLILVAVIIAFPLSWWAMNMWLDNFAYRINIESGVYLMTFLVVMFITLVTISFQSIKAAISNPVKSLRAE
jgi:ABC-type antimicrobial peptide transport system permease subunit